MARVVHFEIHADDPERARRFYEGVFGWEIKKWSGPADYWPITTGPDSEMGINGAITNRMGPLTGDGITAYVCTVGVDSLDETLTKVIDQGGTLALPKMSIPTIGWLAYCKDTEGNIFGVLQPDESAQ
jgi:predicted enzyme related to lactoylglutathione lyase